MTPGDLTLTINGRCRHNRRVNWETVHGLAVFRQDLVYELYRQLPLISSNANSPTEDRNGRRISVF